MKFFIISLLTIGGCLIHISPVQAQVVAGEWFFDQPDPGIGNATAFSNFTPDTLITTNIQSPLTALSSGLHLWNVRVKDAAGIWSHTYTRPFVVLPRDTVAPIAGGEWFWDVDPGYGMGTPMSLNGHLDTANLTIPLDTLTAGIHSLYTRAKNTEGRWGHTFQRNTFIKAEPDAPIAEILYQFRAVGDTTPGYTYTLMQPQHYIDLSFEPNVSDLIDNTEYELCLQVMRTDSQISCEKCQTFTYSVDDPNSIFSGGSASSLLVFPNPNQGEFKINLPENRQQVVQLEAVDMQGRSVFKRNISPTAESLLDVKLDQAVPGVYLIIVEIGQRLHVSRIQIK